MRRKKYWINSGIIFIHTPKAAGTSISHALYGRTLGHFRASEIKNYCPKEFASLYKFSFVRNPWARLVSAYNFVVKEGTDTAGIKHPERYKTKPFRNFESFVYEWLDDKDLLKLDYVFQPQHLFIFDLNNKIMVNFIGKVENFERDLKKLSTLIGKHIPPFCLNQTSNNSNYIEFYQNRNLINTVGKIYEVDVSLLKYDFQ